MKRITTTLLLFLVQFIVYGQELVTNPTLTTPTLGVYDGTPNVYNRYLSDYWGDYHQHFGQILVNRSYQNEPDILLSMRNIVHPGDSLALNVDGFASCLFDSLGFSFSLNGQTINERVAVSNDGSFTLSHDFVVTTDGDGASMLLIEVDETGCFWNDLWFDNVSLKTNQTLVTGSAIESQRPLNNVSCKYSIDITKYQPSTTVARTVYYRPWSGPDRKTTVIPDSVFTDIGNYLVSYTLTDGRTAVHKFSISGEHVATSFTNTIVCMPSGTNTYLFGDFVKGSDVRIGKSNQLDLSDAGLLSLQDTLDHLDHWQSVS